MDWNFESVKCLDELVEQYGGRKSIGQEAEIQRRIEKEWASLQAAVWREFCGFLIGLPNCI